MAVISRKSYATNISWVPDEEETKGRFADIEAIVWCDLAEYDEAMNGDDDRRKQQRPDRVLQKTQSFTRNDPRSDAAQAPPRLRSRVG